MAWTTPRCWTTGEVVTAAIMTTHVRDNFNVTAPAVLTTAGDILYASGSNVPARLAKGTNGNILHQASCAPAWTASPSFTGLTLSGDLTVSGGCIVLTGAATDVDLIDNNASALSFDASGQAGIIAIVTTNCSEGVTMSGTLGVTGVLTATGGLAGGAIDNGTSNLTSGGTWSVDVDATGTDGTCLSAAGTLRFGASQDLRVYHGGTNNYVTGVTGDLIIGTQGSGGGIILDAEDDTLEIKYSGAAGANFGTGGLNLVSGDVYSIACTEVLSGSALASAVKLNNGNWSGTDLSVANGGTGASTFTANGILVGNGASAVAVTATMATKGHLMIGDGSGVPTMLGVGSNCEVLTACSGEATGVKWAASAGAAITSTANGSDNRVATYTDCDSLNGEANLTFTGSALALTGTMTISSTLTMSGNLDVNSQSLLNVGAAANDWTQNAFTLAGGSAVQKLTVGDGTNPTKAHLVLNVNTCANDGARLSFLERDGDGSAGDMGYHLIYTPSVAYFAINSEDVTGSDSAADVLRIPDGQSTIDANTTFDENVFDAHDDAMVLFRAFSPAGRGDLEAYQFGQAALQHSKSELADIGVLRRYYKACGDVCPDFLGYNDQRMAALLAGGIYQTRQRVDELRAEYEARIQQLEERINAHQI